MSSRTAATSTTTTTITKIASTITTRTTLLAQITGPGSSKENDDESVDIPPEELSKEYTGSVDWDAEWKKVMKNEGKLPDGTERPGSSFYKSEAEIAAIKTANAATKKVVEAGSTVTNVLPDVRSLSGDWRFWISILALISVGLSLLSAPANVPSGLPGDSYYI